MITVGEAGVVYGLNGWPSNATDIRHYEEMTPMSDLDELLADEAEHAEQHRNDPSPPGAKGRRPNRAKSEMFSLRLNPEELGAVQDLARRAGVPVSALVRGWIVQRVAAERGTSNDAAAVVDQLEADVRRLRELVAPKAGTA